MLHKGLYSGVDYNAFAYKGEENSFINVVGWNLFLKAAHPINTREIHPSHQSA